MNELKVNGQTLSIEQELQNAIQIKHGGVRARRKAVKVLTQAYMPIASYVAQQVHASLVFHWKPLSVEAIIDFAQQLTKVAVKKLRRPMWADDAPNFREGFVLELLELLRHGLAMDYCTFDYQLLTSREKQHRTEHDLKMIMFKNFELFETIWMVPDRQVKAVNRFLSSFDNTQAA